MQEGTTAMDFAKISTLLDELVMTETVPGANVLIRQHGRELFYHQAGNSDLASGKEVRRDTIFRLLSMTKPVVAAATMILVDDGVLQLDDPVADHIPEFAQLEVYGGMEGDARSLEPARPMRIKHLLTHMAGFSYWFQQHPVGALYASDPLINNERWRFDPSFDGTDGLVRQLSKLPLAGQPGERWHYSMSLEVAGIVVERATGQSLDTFMSSRIFEPLAMSDTAFWVEPDKADRLASLYVPSAEGGLQLAESASESLLLKPVPGLAGGGGLVSTVDDYSRFAEMLLAGGELDGQRVLSVESARAMMTNQVDRTLLGELPFLAEYGLGGAGDGLGFGLGGAVVMERPTNGVPAFPGEYSWGGGTSTTFWVDPANDLTVVFMTQRLPPSRDMPRDRLHTAVYDALGLTG